MQGKDMFLDIGPCLPVVNDPYRCFFRREKICTASVPPCRRKFVFLWILAEAAFHMLPESPYDLTLERPVKIPGVLRRNVMI